MYRKKAITIIAAALLIISTGIFSAQAQNSIQETATNAEDNMAKMDALAIEQMNSNGQMRIVARLGNKETDRSLNKKRLEAARAYLVETRGLPADKLTLAEGEKAAGLGRLEIYLGETLMDVLLGERGKIISFTCCGNDASEPESKTKTPDRSKVETQIIALEKQAWEAWKNKDLAFFQSYLTDDALSVNAGGVFHKAQILEYYGSCEVKSYSLDNFKFRQLEKNSALITFTAVQDAVCDGNPTPKAVRSTSVYVKRGGKWLNALYMETSEIE